MKTLEKIGEFQVHPVASLFPMAGEEEFYELIKSISSIGLQEPIVVHEGLLVDGRNRLKACIQVGIPARAVEWSSIVSHNHYRAESPDDYDATSVDLWIMGKNIARRHLTMDQRVALWTQYNFWLDEELSRERQKATQFEKGQTGNETGRRGKKQVDLNSGPPDKARDIDQKHTNSTAGKIATATGSSRHKAEQAVKLVKAVEDGTAPKEDLDLVVSGLKKLNEAVKPLKPEKPDKPKPDLETTVLKSLQKLLDKFSVADHPRVKAVLIDALTKNPTKDSQ